MKLYLDAKDLINILQKATPCTADHLEENLRRGGHKLTMSFYTVSEVSVPLVRATSKTNVMALLNRLEKMPITFIRSDIDGLELKEALDAYSSKREYRGIHDFMTLDRRMHGYVSQASASVSLDYRDRIFKSTQDLLCRL